jgi:hypothetical protein
MKQEYFDKEDFIDKFIEEFEKDVKTNPISDENITLFIKYFDKYGSIKWNQACEAQIEKCSDKLYDLLYTDDDAETWHEKIKSTKNAEYDDEF